MKLHLPRFSIITPVYLGNPERVEQFLRCVESVKNLTFKDFEWVIVDDGSPEPFLWDNFLKDLPVKLVHKLNENRVIAYNRAFKVAKGEWWIFLDSDDELDPRTLEVLDKAIKDSPEFKMFNFGSIHNWRDGSKTIFKPFRPQRLEVGHEMFGGGNIVNGTFIFHKSVYKALGGYPKGKIRNIDCTELNYPASPDQEKPYIRDLNMGTPYDFSAAAQLEFPELQTMFMEKHPDHPEKLVKELGNPWGQDFYLFYKYTRKYWSLPIDENLYIVNRKP